MSIKHRVVLTEDEDLKLRKIVSSGHTTARKIIRARILLLANEAAGHPALRDEQITEALGVCRTHVHNVRKCFTQDGLEAALDRKPQPLRPDKRCLDGKAEAHLIALACSQPPDGRAVWTMQLLAEKLVSLSYCDAVSDETVRLILKKTRSSLGKKRNGAFRRRPTPTSSVTWRTS